MRRTAWVLRTIFVYLGPRGMLLAMLTVSCSWESEALTLQVERLLSFLVRGRTLRPCHTQTISRIRGVRNTCTHKYYSIAPLIARAMASESVSQRDIASDSSARNSSSPSSVSEPTAALAIADRSPCGRLEYHALTRPVALNGMNACSRSSSRFLGCPGPLFTPNSAPVFDRAIAHLASL